jgi:hypothetical protein
MHAVTGAYAGPIFVEKLGADPVAYQFTSDETLNGLKEHLMLNLNLVCRIAY